MRRTLKQQIESNKRASFIYSFLLVLLLAGLGGAITGSYVPDYWWAGAAMAGVIGLICGLVAWSAGPQIVLSISGARDATTYEEQVVRNVAEEMAIAAGIPMPKVVVIDDSAPNAFATGKDPQNGVVCVTTGLIRKLDRDELQGVVAHEIAHIRNYDIKLMTVLAVVAGLIPLLADFFRMSLWAGGRKKENSGAAVFVIIGLALAILAPIFAKLLELAVSRQREYMADASAAELTRYPDGLARALEKIAADHDHLEAANRATAHLYIINPLKAMDEVGSSLFSTHPPTSERIRRLRLTMGTAGEIEQRMAQQARPD